MAIRLDEHEGCGHGDLNALDSDGNGEIATQETIGHTVSTVNEGHPFTIHDKTDALRFEDQLRLEGLARGGRRFGESYSSVPGRPSTEAWLAERSSAIGKGQSLPPPVRVYATPIEGLSARLVAIKSGKQPALLMEMQDTNGLFSFTLHLNANPDETVLECGGLSFKLGAVDDEISEDDTAISMLVCATILLQEPLPTIDQAIQQANSSRLAALYYNYKAKADFTLTMGELFSEVRQERQEIDPSVKERIALREAGQLCHSVGTIHLNGPDGNALSLDVIAEKEVSQSTLQTLSSIMREFVPPSYLGILLKNGLWPTLRLEIVEDDMMDQIYDSTTIGKLDVSVYPQRVIVRRSTLKGSPSKSLAEIIVHEFGHALLPKPADFFPADSLWGRLYQAHDAIVHKRYATVIEASDEYFLYDLWAEAENKTLTSQEMHTTSVYALKDAMEFFTEHALAYSAGEKGIHTTHAPVHGVKSRAEVRDLQPEMYIALRVFLEPRSCLYGKPGVFLKQLRPIVQQLASDPSNLDPDFPAEQLAEKFRMMARQKS